MLLTGLPTGMPSNICSIEVYLPPALVQDINKDSISQDDQSAYWYHRYSLRPLLDAQGHVVLTSKGAAVYDVPTILADAEDSILTTGKYLNAIRECGRQVLRPLPPDVHLGTYVPQSKTS